MDLSRLEKFSQEARRSLGAQVSTRLQQVLLPNSAARREKPAVVANLEALIRESSSEQVIERVAYTWFNRFCALRFMDVNRYTPTGVVSPEEGQSQPGILAAAKNGHIDEEMAFDEKRKRILDLLNGSAPSPDPQGEAYRMLIVAACNYWNRAMPFLFERIDDYTELLMPEDLLSANSILAHAREAMTEDNCKDVEVIGWLYQFYISEKKDKVFEGLKKKKSIKPEDIPAATQLFTPHWIVRYLVENSIGHLWMLNHPQSKLGERMDYYIKPVEPEPDFLRIGSPEEIKICDLACGSGHMLTYAFDLLYAIYEEEGYPPDQIPGKILAHNLFGVEIDERAGELAAFALTMKARSKCPHFFSRPIAPHICVLENIQFEDGELKRYMDHVGKNLFTAPVLATLHQFEEADNFGSLIRPELTSPTELLKELEKRDVSDQLLIARTHRKVILALRQADFLSSKYHIGIANPPYMGAKGMNNRLASWVKESYPDSKSDLFAMFIERNLRLVQKSGMVAMITMQSWMFLSSYEALRLKLLEKNTILSMAHLGARSFDSIGGEVVSTTAFVLENAVRTEYKGSYLRVIGGGSEAAKEASIREAIKNSDCGWFYRSSADDFKKIPGSPISYWASNITLQSFSAGNSLATRAVFKHGMSTSDNNRYLRQWYEVARRRAKYDAQDKADTFGKARWFPYLKGGSFRRWYGNNDLLVNWECDGKEIRQVSDIKYPYLKGNLDFVLGGQKYFFKQGYTWSSLTTGNLGLRKFGIGHLFDAKGQCYFADNIDTGDVILCLLNSKVSCVYCDILSPTLDYNSGVISKIPLPRAGVDGLLDHSASHSKKVVAMSKSDWDAYETSWDFTGLPLVQPEYRSQTLESAYAALSARWKELTREMQRLENDNNRIFIEAYGLQNELSPAVPLNEITLTCNPHYRYGGGKSDDELESLQLIDTMKEFISYAVGCMFGRYALEKPGLVLANQGETFEDYLKQVPKPSFPADKDNVIPILDGDWFPDDITERFRKFLRVTFGEEHYDENIRFIEEAIGKDIRKYFLKDFYGDHVKRYKKRPIYWLFSSPAGSFNALIYMHRYRSDTASVVLNDYMREFRAKLTARKSHLEAVSISGESARGEKTRAIKEIEKIRKIIEELNEYERDVLYPLATRKVEIDLDDGVKVNYPKFGAALRPIPGLEQPEEE